MKKFRFLFTILFLTNCFFLTAKENTSDRFINIGTGFLLTSSEFQTPFKRFSDNKGDFFRMPSNTWNDYTYFIYSRDKVWKYGLRIGWGIEFNLGGSGDFKIDSIKVDQDTDLGKAYGGDFYAIYNSYHFPLYLTIFYPVLNINNKFEILLGGSGGAVQGIFTYNELVSENRSSVEEAAEKSFFTFNYMAQINFLIKFQIISSIEPMFISVVYRFTENPILTNDFLANGEISRRIQFQADGLMLAIGFRYK